MGTIDSRQNFRLRKQLELGWEIPSQNIQGEATVFNVSTTGLLMVTDRLFTPEHGLLMTIKVQDVPAFPAKGRLMWFRKLKDTHYQCGLKFVKECLTPAWIQWLQDNILKLADAQDNSILDRYLMEG